MAQQQIMTNEGKPLKQALRKALRREKLRSLMLIAPLLAFVLVAFIAPIGDMLFRSVENNIVADTLPKTTVALKEWDASTGNLPDEATYEALYDDLTVAVEEWLKRIPEFELSDPDAVRWATGQVRGPRELPVRILSQEA